MDEIQSISWENRFKHWLLQGVKEVEGPHEREGQHHQQPWWKVMCLTGVDYFSTLGYQPGIAFLAASYISPLATFILVLLTLFGALPIYTRVAAESPHGQGSISMLEALFSRWRGKLFVLVLLGFVATDFVITITLSAADATEHVLDNPFVVSHLTFLEGHQVAFTLFLILMLGAIFLKGFKEAIGIAVFLVAAYLLLNLVVIAVGGYEILTHTEKLPAWKTALFSMPEVNGRTWMLVGMALLVFPKLALGLSGFETGVAVMPLVKGPHRIQNTRKLLTGAALIMSFMLICSSFVTTILIPAEEFKHGGKAYGRALAFLAHDYLGDYFGTVYDLSTIAILWFAGASALAGLLNIVPRYLPRYGMAPEWGRATRPLVFVFITICFFVTIIFDANVEKQGGAYATGVLVLMSSAAIAVFVSAWRKRQKIKWAYLFIAFVFLYTTIQNIHERPDGIKIASFFIMTIVATSFMSRVLRTTELRIDKIHLDDVAQSFIDELNTKGTIRIVTNRREVGDAREYEFKELEKRADNHIPSSDPVIFFEVDPGDASQFTGTLKIQGVNIEGYKVLRTSSAAVPNAIAGFLLHLRDETGKIPHVYFGWSEGNPVAYLLKYVFFGEGDTAPVTHEVLRKAEPDPAKRPSVHVGG